MSHFFIQQVETYQILALVGGRSQIVCRIRWFCLQIACQLLEMPGPEVRMARSIRTKNSELLTRFRNPESVLQLEGDEPVLSVQDPTPGENEHSSVAIKEKKAVNRREQ